MSKIPYILILLCFFTFSFAQKVDLKWVTENYTKKEMMVPMRDGVKLHTTIYAPNSDSEKHPILMTRTPYSCAPYGVDKYSIRLYTSYWKEYLKEGYIIVIQDVRGRWMSEGEFVDVRPYNPNKKKKTDIDEASDTYDAIDWLIKNIKNNNGNVGVFGISYPGFYSTMAALSGHPAVKAVSPQAPVTEWFMGDDFHHNGAFMMMDAFGFYSSFGKPRPKPTTVGPKGYKFYTEDKYKFYLETGALKNLSKQMGDSVKFWNDLMNHPNYDDWWKARDARVGFKNPPKYIPPVLVVGGVFDAEDCYGAWRLYEAIEKSNPNLKNQIVMGPWYHGGWSRGDGSKLGNIQFGSKTSEYYQQNIEIPFFNFYLKGKGNIDRIKEANIFFTGENNWRTFESWPPAKVSQTSLFLNEGKRLSYNQGSGLNLFSSYVSDPSKPVPYTDGVIKDRTREYMTDDQRFSSTRTDVLTFTTAKLDEDVTLAGTILADLKVALSTTDADFIVKVIDVFPEKFMYDSLQNENGYLMDSYQMLVRGEVMRGRYRNSFEKPEAFIPGKIETVKFELPDVAHTFKKGHQIMVQIQSTWFPLVDRNPQQFVDIYHCEDKDFIPSEIKIFHDAQNPSRLVLPVLK
jgi:putative CocE/NonD family hydrolase